MTEIRPKTDPRPVIGPEVRPAPRGRATPAKPRASTPPAEPPRPRLLDQRGPVPPPRPSPVPPTERPVVPGPGPAQPALPAEAIRDATEATRREHEKTEKLRVSGVEVTGSPAGPPVARTTRDHTLRSLAGAVHDIPEERVGPGELEVTRAALVRPPGEGTDAPVAAGTEIRLGATPVGVALERENLRRVRALTSTPEAQRLQGIRDPAALHTAIASREAELDRVSVGLQHRAKLGEVNATVEPLTREGQTDAVAAAYARLENDPALTPQARAAVVLSKAEALTRSAVVHKEADRPSPSTDALRRADDELVKLSQATPELTPTVEVMRARIAEERADLIARQPLTDPDHREAPYSEFTVPPLPRTPNELALERVADVTRVAAESRERLQRLALENPAQKPMLDAAVLRLDARTRELSADVLVRGGDHRRAAEAHLPAGLRDLAPVLAPDANRRLDPNGVERTRLGGIVHGATEVGELSTGRLRSVVDRINEKSRDERRAAIDALVAIGLTHARVGDTGHLNAIRQVLSAVERDGGPTTPVQRRMLEAAVHERTRNFPAADAVLRDARRVASELPPGADRHALEGSTLLARAAVLRRGALEGDDDTVKARSARELRAFREELTRAPGPLSRNQLASLTLMEADTLLRGGDPRQARATLESLGSFSDLPWTREAAAAFRRDNSDAGLWAALKVGLHAANAGNLAVDVGVPLGAGAVGAAAGALVGGPVGAGIGFLGGSVVGVVATRAYNVARGWDKVLAARDTGLTHLRWHDAALDTAALGVDVLTSAAPLKGVARIGTAGLTALATRTGAGTAEALAVATARLGAHATNDAIEAEARRVLGEQFLAATTRFGGRAVTGATAGAVIAPFAAQYAAIARMKDGPAKTQALNELELSLQRTALLATGTALTAGATLRLARALGQRTSGDMLGLSREELLRRNPQLLPPHLDYRTPDGVEGRVDFAGTQFTWLRIPDNGTERLVSMETRDIFALNRDRLFGEPPPPTGVEIGARYATEHHVPPGVRLPDDYRDTNFGHAETILVQRSTDAQLRADLELARGLRHLPEAHRVHEILRRVHERHSPNPNDFHQPWRENFWAGPGSLAQLFKGRDVALGAVCGLGGGVCRHRAALFKAMADDADLRVGMQRGSFLRDDGTLSSHAWNTWEVGGQLRVIDPSAPGLWAYVSPTQAARYLDYNNRPLYVAP